MRREDVGEGKGAQRNSVLLPKGDCGNSEPMRDLKEAVAKSVT